eukprot:scaffold70203_cov31-Tisochrysis_lutea.AAC.5
MPWPSSAVRLATLTIAFTSRFIRRHGSGSMRWPATATSGAKRASCGIVVLAYSLILSAFTLMIHALHPGSGVARFQVPGSILQAVPGSILRAARRAA